MGGEARCRPSTDLVEHRAVVGALHVGVEAREARRGALRVGASAEVPSESARLAVRVLALAGDTVALRCMLPPAVRPPRPHWRVI